MIDPKSNKQTQIGLDWQTLVSMYLLLLLSFHSSLNFWTRTWGHRHLNNVAQLATFQDNVSLYSISFVYITHTHTHTHTNTIYIFIEVDLYKVEFILRSVDSSNVELNLEKKKVQYYIHKPKQKSGWSFEIDTWSTIS